MAPTLPRSRDEHGASASEYAVLMTLIAVVVMAGIVLLGRSTAALYDKPCEELSAVGSPC